VDSPLRLIASNPVDRLARTVEALLVVASVPLSVAELAEAADDDPERVETALALLRERYAEGRSGIVLERVAGGYAFRASRDAADACARLFERPVERGLSQAALETLAIVAYLGPCSRPEIARIRGVAADSAVASLVERGLIAEAGRESGERVWPFPLEKDYDQALKSDIADVKQCTLDSDADHIIAASFLRKFIEGDMPWVHIDLSAGNHKGGLAHIPTGITGFGVRFTLNLLLDQKIMERG